MANIRETIEWLKSIKEKYIHGGDECFDEKRRQAIDYAVAVLECQEIDREKLMKLLRDVLEDGCVGHCNYPHCFRVKNTADYLITNGVTVQKWIPVTERLPENDVWVLVCKQDIKTGWMSITVDRCTLTVGGDRLWLNDYATWKTVVTHWMPLPEPPKGE